MLENNSSFTYYRNKASQLNCCILNLTYFVQLKWYNAMSWCVCCVCSSGSMGSGRTLLLTTGSQPTTTAWSSCTQPSPTSSGRRSWKKPTPSTYLSCSLIKDPNLKFPPWLPPTKGLLTNWPSPVHLSSEVHGGRIWSYGSYPYPISIKDAIFTH